MGRADGTFAGHQIVSTGLKSGVINQIEPTALGVLAGILVMQICSMIPKH